MHQTSLNSIKSLRILLSPLNWGLGHVCRTVPIIQLLIDQGNEVIICCDDHQEQFYRAYFPELWYIPHEGYPFRFQGKGNWKLDMINNYTSLNHHLENEKRRVEDLVNKFNPELIISDQRYGFVSKRVKSVVISHQLNLPVSSWNVLARYWNRRLLSKFDEIWIPDTAEQKYSGILSNGKHKKKHFIGTLSRFNQKEKKTSNTRHFTYLGIVSGPLPYNQQFLDLLIDKLSQSNHNSVIIVPPEIYQKADDSTKIRLISSPCHEKFIELMNETEVIISRSGYSTLMDLRATKKECILIPTPGQAEQLYLAKIHKNHPFWDFKTEEEFALLAL